MASVRLPVDDKRECSSQPGRDGRVVTVNCESSLQRESRSPTRQSRRSTRSHTVPRIVVGSVVSGKGRPIRDDCIRGFAVAPMMARPRPHSTSGPSRACGDRASTGASSRRARSRPRRLGDAYTGHACAVAAFTRKESSGSRTAERPRRRRLTPCQATSISVCFEYWSVRKSGGRRVPPPTQAAPHS